MLIPKNLIQNKKTFRLIIICSSGFFLLLDQIFKYLSQHNWLQTKTFANIFGWKPFLNQGIAFGIPLPNYFIIILSFLIIIFIFYLLKKEYGNFTNLLAWSLVLSGAISNLIDRLFFGYVIDYWLFFTSIINLADVLIVIGLLIYILNTTKRSRIKKGIE